MSALRIIRHGSSVCLLTVLLLLCAARTQAQAPAPSPAPASQPASAAADSPEVAATPALTPTWVKTKIDEIEARKDISAAVRDQSLALYRDALSQLEAAEASTTAAAAFQEAIQSAPKRTEEIKRKLATLAAPPGTTASVAPPSGDGLSLADTEQRLDTIQAVMATLQTDLNEFDSTLLSMAARPTAARKEQSVEKQKLDELTAPTQTASIDEDAIVAEARRSALTAERSARSARVNLLEQEVISLSARQALASAQRDLAAAKLERLERQVPLLEAHINELRQSEALQKQAQAELVTRQLSGRHPVLEDYAKATTALRQRQTELTRTIETEQATQSAIDADTGRIRESTQAAQQILEIGRVGEELGGFLRDIRSQLPALSALRTHIRDREQSIIDARLQRLNVDKNRRGIADPAAATQRLLALIEAGRAAAQSETARGLVTARADALTRLSEAYTLRIDQLAKTNAAEHELLSQTIQLDALLNERLLWLPNVAPLGWTWVVQIREGVAWLSSPANWLETGEALVARVVALPLPSLLVVVAFTLLWVSRRRLRRQLAAAAEAVGRPTTDGYLWTPRALAATALLSLHWPLLMGYVGWLLTSASDATEFTACVGNGLITGAFVVALLRFLQLLCVKDGLFAAHFEWGARATQILSRSLGWFILVAAPVAVLTGMIEVGKAQVYRDGLGRLTFIAGALAIAGFAFRVFSPHKGVLAERMARTGAMWMSRGIWYPLLWGVPLALAAFAVTGYYDSASQLLIRCVFSVGIGVLTLITYGVAMREVLVARRRLEMQRAYERREKARAAAASREANEASGDATPQALEASEIDVASISQQTRALVRMITFVGLALGLWFVWKELLPALGVLDNVALWTQTITSETGTKIVPVTLWNLLLALGVAGITFIAARNLPGLLEMLLLQRLSIEAGTRYAITALSRYSIIAVGLLVAFNRIGADWSQLQWIVAALGVGVGFGLQEIVANFVSGLIILFERPVRVGDTVTIGDLSGTVSRIQIRATSITDWDNREILVPNKALITDKVMNWTLTDSVTRLLVPVGIAYGSDTALAQKLMLDVVKDNATILETPQPSVFFLGFGDSSLNYEVRAFVALPAHRLPVLHDLHVGIDQALRAHNIAIPFPQRDLHMKFADIADAAQSAGTTALRQKLKEAG
jgi:potassium-dependent mechanosensitive channel